MEFFKTLDIEIKENEKLNKVKNILLILYVALETLYKTIAGMYFASDMDRLQCVVAVLLIGLVAVEFLRLDKENKIKWLKKNVLVIGYFIVRLITFIHVGMEYTVIRSMLFEVVYLVALTELLVSGSLCRNIIMKAFVIANLILNVFNTAAYEFCRIIYPNGDYAGSSLFNFIVEKTYVDFNAEGLLVWQNSAMYGNPNQMGLMTGMAVLITLNYLSKNMSAGKKIAFVLYYIFSAYCIIFSDCASVLVGLVGATGAFILVKLIKSVNRKKIIFICLACCIAVTAGAYAYISTYEEYRITYTEYAIDQATSHRYGIWKDCYHSHQEEMLLGCGNITLEKRDRYQYNLDKGIDYGYDINESLIDFYGPHNGYIGMLSCAGILGSLMFLLTFIKKIADCKMLNKKSWYLLVVFLLVINLFECMIIISKNFCCLYLFLILAMDDNEDDETGKLPVMEEIK